MYGYIYKVFLVRRSIVVSEYSNNIYFSYRTPVPTIPTPPFVYDLSFFFLAVRSNISKLWKLITEKTLSDKNQPYSVIPGMCFLLSPAPSLGRNLPLMRVASSVQEVSLHLQHVPGTWYAFLLAAFQIILGHLFLCILRY